MTPSEFEKIVQPAREGANLEFKESISWVSSEIKAKLTKTVLAMSNLRDGGHVVIGVKELSSGSFEFTGMHPEHIDSFSEDNLRSHIGEYAEPYVQFDLDKVEYGGKNFVVLSVREFDLIPVICKKDGLYNLKQGGLYVRPRRKAETSEIRSQTEMREILEIATEKGVRQFLELQARIGVRSELLNSSEEQFAKQLADLV